MMGEVGLDSTGAAIPDWKPKKAPEAVAPELSNNPIVRSTEGLWLGARESSAGFYELGANVFGLIHKADERFSQWTGAPKGQASAALESFLRQAAQSVRPTEKDFENRNTFTDYLFRAIGAAPVTIGEYVIGGKLVGSGIAGMALIDAIRSSDKGWWEASKGALQGAIMGTALKAVEPFSRPVRAMLGAAGFGGLAAVEGQPTSSIAAQAVVGGGMAALGQTPSKAEPTHVGPPDISETKALPSGEKLALPTPKEGPIRGEGPGPLKELPPPELRADTEAVNAHIQQRGVDSLLQEVMRNVNDPRMRQAVEIQRQRYAEESKFGPTQQQIITEPVVKKALAVSESTTAIPEGSINPDFAAQEVDKAAAELQITPRSLVTTIKAVEQVKQAEPELRKAVEQQIQKDIDTKTTQDIRTIDTGRTTKTFVSAPEAPVRGTFKEGVDLQTRNPVMAAKLKSGEIAYDTEAKTHAEMKGVDFNNVVETGFLIDNKYTNDRDLAQIRKFEPARAELADSQLAAQKRLEEKNLLNQKGFSTFDVNFALARTLSGAVYGFTQGDTIEERIKNALFYGGLGALASPKMIKTIYRTFRGLDPQGINRIEHQDQGRTATVDQAFNAKEAPDTKGMAEFLKMTNEGLDVKGRVQGINYDHINTPMDVKYTIGKMAKVYQAELEKARGLGKTHEELIRETDRLQGTKAGEPSKILEWPDGKPMTDAELLLTRMMRNDLGVGLKNAASEYKVDPSPTKLVSFIDNFNRYRMIQTVYGGQASGRGRGLEALKIDVGASGEVEFHHMLGNVVESIDPTGWTPERLAGAIEQIPNLSALSQAVDIAARPGMHDMLLEAFYGVSMLSNPRTWVVNMTGSPMAFAWQVAKRSIAAGSTVLMGKIGDPNYVQPVEPLVMLGSIKDGYHDAFLVAKRAFETGERQYLYSYGGKHALSRPNAITYENLKAVYPNAFNAAESALGTLGVDAQKLKYGIDLLGSAARVSTRLMLAPDEFNELIGARMELYARSARAAASEGLSLSEQMARARGKIYNQEGFSSADKEAAKTFALYNTFNQTPGSFMNRLIRAVEALNKSPDIDPVWYLATKAIVPFMTIPANIARWAARESGPTAFLSRQLKTDMAKGGVEAQTAWAGVALGSMVMTLAANMAMNGHLLGAAPVQKADRLAWEADGNMEYSIKTPVGTFGINRLDPIAIPFAWAADFVNIAGHMDAYDSLTLTTTMLLTLTHDLASKNYVQGITNFLHAVTSMDSKEIQQFAKSQTGSLLSPGFIRAIRQETDPYRRATNTTLDAARQSTPWGSTDYPPILDRFARPIYTGYGASQGWVSIFGILNPIQYREPRDNRVISEVIQNKIPIPGLSDTIFGARDNPFDNKPPDSRTGIKLEGWEYYLYNKYSGEKLFELLSKQIDTLTWKKASPGPDGGKAREFMILTAAADEYARARLLTEFPELKGALVAKEQKRIQALRPKPAPGSIQVP
jgi:hypothetical protein